MGKLDDIFSLHASLRDRTREVEMSLGDYLEACREGSAVLRERGRTHAARYRRAGDGGHVA